MYPTKIENHVVQSQDLLLQQFRDKLNILKLSEVYLSQHQDLEDEWFSLLDSLGVDSASKYALDLIGKEVGEARQGKDDEDYRDAIKTRIFINNSSGTPEEVIAAALQITKADAVNYSEQYPAGVALEIIGAEYVSKAPLIKSTLPAGVDLIFQKNMDIDTAQFYGGVAYSFVKNFESNPVLEETLTELYVGWEFVTSEENNRLFIRLVTSDTIGDDPPTLAPELTGTWTYAVEDFYSNPIATGTSSGSSLGIYLGTSINPSNGAYGTASFDTGSEVFSIIIELSAF